MTSNNFGESKAPCKKKIKVRTTHVTSSTTSLHPQEEDEYIPLAARDSKWVGLNVPNLESRLQYSKEQNNEIILMELMIDDEDAELPLYTLFPGLKERISEENLMQSSTDSANVIKLLVGQKPDFTNIRKSTVYIPGKPQLPSLTESPSDDTIEDRTVNSEQVITKPKTMKKVNKTKSLPLCYEGDDETDASREEIKKKKVLIKRVANSNPSRAYDSESSYSGSVHNYAPSKKKNTSNKAQDGHSQGSITDDEG